MILTAAVDSDVSHLVVTGRGNVLNMDISDGKDNVRIPLINDTGDEIPEPNFRYVMHFDSITPAAQRVIDQANHIGIYSGCQKKKHLPNYDENGCLRFTVPEGIKECPLSCTGCNNSVVSMGVRYPLEVFRTEDKGWGVRCSVDIPSGAFICEYVGEVLTDEEAVCHVLFCSCTTWMVCRRRESTCGTRPIYTPSIIFIL